jgi:3-oxoadipate enol-lactonase
MAAHRIPVEGAELRAEEDGTGPALMLVNGAFCTVRQWDRVVPGLAASRRVIRHDVRGTGQSSAGPESGYRFEQYADDIAALCDHLQVERAALWGMAWGARVALVTAARHASRFSRVVLSDLAIDPADVGAQRAGARTAAEARARAGIPSVPPPDGWNDHADVDEARKALFAAALHRDLMPVARQVSQPVLIATGEHDPNLASSRRALGGLENGRLEVLPHTGHGSVLQRPDLVLRTVLRFLDDSQRDEA